jgi:outer membrane lipoprotein carrier protein
MRYSGTNRIFVMIISLAVVIFPFTDSSAYKVFKFTTVSDVVKKVKQTFSELESYQADFRIVSEKLGNKSYKSGVIRYKASDKMLVEFNNPKGQKILSDGKRMWIYIPSMNVVAEQDLKSDSDSFFSSGTRSGLKRLFSKYHYKFASKTQPEKQDDGSKKYTLFLKQMETRSGFRSIKLWISEDFFITRAYGESTTGKSLEIDFSNIKTNIVLPNDIFQFDIPPKARIIKNPMLSEE